MKLTLDHLVLGTADLAQSAAQLTEWFGVAPFGGGEHDLFATHNKLWRLDAPNYPIYLELIAINPAAEPQQARWFGLDACDFSDSSILPIGMVARCVDIVTAVQQFGPDHYDVLALSRGDLHWKFAVERSDYCFPSQYPNLIEWEEAHPLDGVASQGLTLEQVVWPQNLALDLDWPCSAKLGDVGKFGFVMANAIGQTIQF
ncbi:VOC family protein [Maritalea mediterranea]|uniref:VOC family protein n=1 Tax=Maritalea mediterranea TaxID=2909667 RepID=A0ABS9EAL3_9HYPH|nr:VOC family protein [Maritalea mediterranea]MCF4099926.1 VOC family protein [Maritalea mediterranea]